MSDSGTAELNPPKDTLAESDWIEGGGSIGEEIKIIMHNSVDSRS